MKCRATERREARPCIRDICIPSFDRPEHVSLLRSIDFLPRTIVPSRRIPLKFQVETPGTPVGRPSTATPGIGQVGSAHRTPGLQRPSMHLPLGEIRLHRISIGHLTAKASVECLKLSKC